MPLHQSSLKAAEPSHHPCEVVDEFHTTEVRSLAPRLPHISHTMALLMSLVVDKDFYTFVTFMFHCREIILVHYADNCQHELLV